MPPEQTKLALTPQALALLTDGVDLRGAKLRPSTRTATARPARQALPAHLETERGVLEPDDKAEP